MGRWDNILCVEFDKLPQECVLLLRIYLPELTPWYHAVWYQYASPEKRIIINSVFPHTSKLCGGKYVYICTYRDCHPGLYKMSHNQQLICGSHKLMLLSNGIISDDLSSHLVYVLHTYVSETTSHWFVSAIINAVNIVRYYIEVKNAENRSGSNFEKQSHK